MPARKLSVLVALAALLLTPKWAHAGGPLLYADDGTIIKWPAGGGNIPLTLDQGGLGSLDNPAATALVVSILSVWNAVPQSTVNLTVSPTPLSVDVNQTNFIPFLFPPALLGYNPVVYDTDGMILDTLYGAGARNQILGVSFGPEDNGVNIVEGRVLLNGYALGTIVTMDEFKGVIVHELGHLLGLGHSQINTDDPVSQPTMYPIVHPDIQNLKMDDLAWISDLYPTPQFATSFGSITGAAVQQIPTGFAGFQGLNVIARRIGGNRTEAVSCVSGHVFRAGGNANLIGSYLLPGLVTGSYSVELENVLSGFTNGSSVGPLDPPVDFPGTAGHEFYNGAQESSGDDPRAMTPVIATAGAQTPGINIILNTNPPPGGFRAAGEIISAWAPPVYRTSDTLALNLQVMNTSNFDWGCERCPTYRVKIVPSWRPTSEWVVSRWVDDQGNLLRLRPGATDTNTWILLATPPAVGLYHLDVYLLAPDSAGSCQFVPVAVRTVSLQCVEWPDLQVENGSILQTSGWVGDPMTVSFRVKNFGPGPAVRSCWAEVRLSLDTKFDFSPADPWVASALVPPLAVGQSQDFCLRGVVPWNATTGTMNVIIKVDVLNEIPESPFFNGENNNEYLIPQTFTVLGTQSVGPDLAMVGASVFPINPQPGQSAQVLLTIQNIGTQTTGATSADVSISSDTAGRVVIPWISAIPVRSLLPGESLTLMRQAVLPASLRRQSYGLFAIVDPARQVPDVNRANNFRLILNAFTMTGVDLVAQSVSIRPTNGIPRDWVFVGLAVRNAGDMASGPFSAQVFFTTGALEIAFTPPIPFLTLAAGAMVSFADAYQVPDGLAPGNYMVRLKVNCPNDLDPRNNVLDSGLFRRSAADLTVGAVTFTPPEGQAGVQVRLSIQVNNIGDRPTSTDPLLGQTQTSVYLAENPFRSAGDQLWFSLTVPRLGPVGGVPQGFPPETFTFVTTQTVPILPPRPAGYRLLVQCDATNSVVEFNEGNNAIDAGRFRIIIPGPDLLPSRGSVAPVVGAPSRRAHVTARIENNGNQPAVASKLAIHLSPDGVWRTNSPVWVQNIVVPALNPGQSFDYAADLAVPSWAKGAYRVIARCNSTNTVVESNTTNNTRDIGALNLITGSGNWTLYK